MMLKNAIYEEKTVLKKGQKKRKKLILIAVCHFRYMYTLCTVLGTSPGSSFEADQATYPSHICSSLVFGARGESYEGLAKRKGGRTRTDPEEAFNRGSGCLRRC